MLPMFKKSHINTRSIEEYINKGVVKNYSEDSNKKNALKQAALLYKMVDGELFRHGSDREYTKYGLRVVVHDDEPQRKLDIISKCHMDDMGNHYGMNNTIKNVNKLYYWHGLSSHVKMFLKKCEHCKERSKFSMEEWLEEEKNNLNKKRLSNLAQLPTEIKNEIKSLGRIKRATPPETFFIVNAQRKVVLDDLNEDAEMLIDSNNIEYVVETLGNSDDGQELKEVCHVLNVPDIVPMPERYRSREIENFLKYGSYPSDFTSNQKSGLKGPAVQYTIVDDELYHNPSKKQTDGNLRLVVHDDNPALKVKIMVECHLDENGSHLGLNRTMHKVNEKYFWLGLSLDVRKFMAKCKICSQHRGKRFDEDTSRFTEEVKKLKERQEDQESVLTTFTVNSDGTISKTTQQQEYDQVYRLVGNDENDVTEITVKVVNGEIVQTVGEQTPEVFQLGEAELVAIDDDTAGLVKEAQSQGDDETDQVAAIQSITEDDKKCEEECDTVQPETVSAVIKAESDEQQEKTEENIDTGHDKINTVNKITDTNISVEAAIEMLVHNEADKLNQHTDTGNTVTEQTSVTTQLLDPTKYHDQCIYVPKSKKTRAIEKYLESKNVTMGYTSTKLKELSENFMLEDKILYRRASRYKGKQIVIHDDQPELKLRILNEHHRKPNGGHCSEMVTFTNVQYKFFWEELRWDVNRFYSRCSTCVEDGIEIKTKKRVLTVKELIMKELQQRKRVSDTGSNARRNRIFREENKNKLDRFKSWEKYGKDVMEDDTMEDAVVDESIEDFVCEEEVVTNEEESLIQNDAQMEDESDIEINLDEGSDVETTSEELVKLTVYATQEQEVKIREMFQTRGWEYRLESMTRCPNQTGEERQEDFYEMIMMTTFEQDLAIQELFKAGKDAPEAPGVETTEEPEKEQEPSPQVVDQPAEQTTITKKAPDTKVPKKTAVKTKVKIEVDEEQIEKASDKGTKRTAVDLNESIGESRRPRREIKRPRRYSPDRMEEEQQSQSPRKTPKVTDKSKTGTVKEQSTKQSLKTVEQSPSITSKSPQGRRASKVGDNSGSKSPQKSDGVKVMENSSPKKSIETPSRTTRYSTRTKPVHDEPNTNKTGQKRKAELVDSKTGTDSKGNVQQQPEDVKKVKEDNQETRQSGRKKATVTYTVEENTPDDKMEAVEDPDKMTGENRFNFDDSNIADDDDEDDKDDDDDLDDTLSDEDDFDDDDEEKSVDNTALEVLNVDKEFVMEVICIDGLYMCSLCDMEFEKESDCQVHGLQNKCFVDCELCSRMFRKNEKVELEKHKALHETSDKFPCPKCKKVFTDSKCLEIHSRGHAGKKDEHCRLCEANFHTSFQLASHLYRIHGESNMFNCDICKAKFVNMNYMKSEVLFDGILSYFKCVMCTK